MRSYISRIAIALVFGSSGAFAQTVPLTPHTLNAGDIVGALGYVPANAATVATATTCPTASVSVSGCVTVSTGLLSNQGALSVLYGTTPGTAAVGNDSRFALAASALQPGALNPYALLASPAFSGVPTAPTAQTGTNTNQLATTGFVTTAIAGINTGTTYTLPPLTLTTLGGAKASARISAAGDRHA